MPSRDQIVFPGYEITWCDWVPWENVKAGQKACPIPREAGVYEVRRAGDTDYRLDIGMSSDLRYRIRQALVKAQYHSTAQRLVLDEEASQLEVRWARVPLVDAWLVEELLKWRHRSQHGGENPKYVKH